VDDGVGPADRPGVYSPPDWISPPCRIKAGRRFVKVGFWPRDANHAVPLTTYDQQILQLMVVSPRLTGHGTGNHEDCGRPVNLDSAAALLHHLERAGAWIEHAPDPTAGDAHNSPSPERGRRLSAPPVRQLIPRADSLHTRTLADTKSCPRPLSSAYVQRRSRILCSWTQAISNRTLSCSPLGSCHRCVHPLP